jgi:hypothetical protein
LDLIQSSPGILDHLEGGEEARSGRQIGAMSCFKPRISKGSRCSAD